MAFPTLGYSGRTKTGNEVFVYAHKFPGCMLYQKSYVGGVVHTFDYNANCGACAVPSGVLTQQMTIATSCLGTAIGGAPPAGIPVNAPLYSAMSGLGTPAGECDSVLQVEVPDPGTDFANMALICYDQGGSPTPGLSHRAIPRKFNPVDHYVRQRSENRLSLSDLFVSNWDGLKAFSGCPCTIMIAIMPSGFGYFQEIQVYGNVLLNPVPVNWGAEGNDSMTISLEGSFSFCGILSANKVAGGC